MSAFNNILKFYLFIFEKYSCVQKLTDFFVYKLVIYNYKILLLNSQLYFLKNNFFSIGLLDSGQTLASFFFSITEAHQFQT